MGYFLWGLTGLLFLCGQNVRSAVAGAMENCLYVLVPAIFPSLVLCLCLIRITGKPPKLLLKIFRLLGLPDGTVLPFLLGISGGYATGAKLIHAMWEKGRLSKKQARAALSFCVNPGYGFIAGVLKDDGDLVYPILMLSSLIVGVIFCRKEAADFEEEDCPNLGVLFKDALADGISAMTGVIGSVLLFSALSACVPEHISILGLDVTSELFRVRHHLPMAAFLAAFGGLSIFLQVRVLCPFSSWIYVWGMLLKGGIAFLLVFLAQKKGAAVAATLGLVLCMTVTAVRRAVRQRERRDSGTKYGRAYRSMQDTFRLQK